MLKLYTNNPANFFYYNPKMTADYCGYPVQVVLVDAEMEKSKEIKDKKGSGAYPFLETADGKIIRESVAVSQYIARLAGADAFLGTNDFEQAQINQMTGLSMSVLAPAKKVVAKHHWGWSNDAAGCKDAENTLKSFAKALNGALEGKSWLVADRLTLADIVVFNDLIIPFTFAFEAGYMKAIPNVVAWFTKMAKLPVVARTAGYIKVAGGAPAAKPQAAAPAKAEGKKQEGGKKGKGKKEEKPKAEEEDEMDLFGDDDPEEAAAAKEALKKAADAGTKKKKAPPVAKSLVILEVKPWGPDVDLDKLGKRICDEVKQEGLFWKTEFKKEPVAFGVFKIVIGAVVEDAIVSTDLVQEKIEEFEDYVQSVDIVAFNKL